jgi:hypothetical protein
MGSLRLILATAFGLMLSYGMAGAQGSNNASRAFTPMDQMRAGDADDPAELARVWASAIVYVPEGSGRARQLSVGDLAGWRPKAGVKRLPLAIHLHGCSGIWAGTHRRLKYLASLGFVAIAPASFARAKYPRSCNVAAHRGGFYRPILALRQADAGYAIEQGKRLNFVDPDQVLLSGLSEGAIATATFRPDGRGQRIRAKVIEGWTCTAAWPEYHGLVSAAQMPVLALVGADDPWFQNPVLQGDCGAFMPTGGAGQSVVYRTGPLSRRHELLDFAAPRQVLEIFLRAAFPNR